MKTHEFILRCKKEYGHMYKVGTTFVKEIENLSLGSWELTLLTYFIMHT